MILVNNPGSWSYIYAPLRHAEWNGCTPTDLVFPFFMFCMGVAMYISYSKSNFALTKTNVWHAVYRGGLIILIGWALSWFGMFLRHICAGDGLVYSLFQYPWAHLRYLGVFPRLGIVSGVVALLLLVCKPKNVPWLIALFLVAYCVLISLTNSFDLTPDNILARVDLAVLGDEHMYHKTAIINGEATRMAFDPEGLLSTIPCFAHCLMGVLVGRILKSEVSNWDKMARVLRFGSIILLAGFLLDYAYPINKSMWSASYVLVPCGLASLVLGILIWLIDIRDAEKSTKTGFRWYNFFESFGVNPLFIFCLSAILVTVMAVIKFDVAGKTYSLWGAWYHVCMVPLFGQTGGSLACALSLVLVMWCIAYPLYKKKIYIKI